MCFIKSFGPIGTLNHQNYPSVYSHCVLNFQKVFVCPLRQHILRQMIFWQFSASKLLHISGRYFFNLCFIYSKYIPESPKNLAGTKTRKAVTQSRVQNCFKSQKSHNR